MQSTYKLKSNNTNLMLRRSFKMLAMVFVLLILMSSLAGCISVEPGTDSSGGKLLYETSDDKMKSQVDRNGNYKSSGVDVTNEWRVFQEVPVSNQVWSTVPKKDSSKDCVWDNTLRSLAVMMHDSIFVDSLAYSETDYFVDKNSITTLALEPKELTVLVSNVTAEHIRPDGNEVLSKIIQVMQGFAAAILISMWAMGFISQIVNEKFTMETLLKTLMQLLCGILVITNATTLVTAFVDMGIALTNAIGDVKYAAFETLEKDIVEALSTVNIVDVNIKIFSWNLTVGSFVIDFFGPAYAIILMVLPFYAELLCAYKICSIMIMRMLELAMRITFAPIPLAFSAQSGFSQEATRYLRSTLACAVQPALIIVGCTFVGTIAEVIFQIFGSDLAESGGPGGLLGSIAMCMSYFILNAFIGESKHLAQEIIAR